MASSFEGMSDIVSAWAGCGRSSAAWRFLEASRTPTVIVGANEGSMSAYRRVVSMAKTMARHQGSVPVPSLLLEVLVATWISPARAVVGATGVTSIANQVESTGFAEMARNIAAATGRPDVAEQIALTASIQSAMNRSVVASLAKRALIVRIRENVARVKDRARRAQAHIFAATEKARTRKERQRIGSTIARSSAKRIALASALTALAVRTHVDHSPPPGQAVTTTPRKVRGPNSRQRHRFVVEAGPPACHRGRGSRVTPGVLHERLQLALGFRTRAAVR